MIAINGSISGTSCGTYAEEKITSKTGFIRARQSGCTPVYRTGYLQTWDHSWIVSKYPSSSTNPGEITITN